MIGESMTEQSLPDRDRWIREVVARFEGPLLRYAPQITGDSERARDVVQDTFFRLWREEPSHWDGHLAQWLYTVCRNRALDVRRKEQRMTSLTEQQSSTRLSRETPHAELIESQDMGRFVLGLVEGLPENQREVIRLKFQDGLSYREISQITQLSVSNVGYLLHTAIRRLRGQLVSD